ncbi:MAG TPA: MFS transporter [Planktothrix sp.]
MNDNPKPVFVRDRLTWLCYLLIGNYCYAMGAMGPLMPFMRAELKLDCTTAALHFSAWALGVLIAGSTGERIMARLGRPRTAWLCGCALITAITLLIAIHNPVVTICASLICGFNGSTMGQTLATILADRFGSERVIAITEANIVASICTSLAPFVVSHAMKDAGTWRLALVVPIVVFFFLVLCFHSVLRAPRREEQKKPAEGVLPKAYWAYWTVILLSVAAEWSLVFWSAEFLQRACKLPTTDAAQGTAAFLIAMFAGRIAGSRLSRHVRSSTLLAVASFVAIFGFLVFWLAPNPVLNIAGLFITGLGISNFYPLTLSNAIGVVPDLAPLATARVSVASGTAVLCAPLLLGFIADKSSIFTAYGVVGVLLVLAAIMAAVANRAAAEHTAAVDIAKIALPSSALHLQD